MTAEQTRHRRSSRVLKVSLAVLGVVFVAAAIGASVFVRRAEPYLRSQVIRDLNRRFRGNTELGSLQVSIFPRLRGTGENLIVHRPDDGDAPFLSVHHFTVEGTFWGVLDHPLHISSAHVDGLSIVLPPKGDRPDLSGGESNKGSRGISVGTISVDEAQLILPSSKPGKRPLHFEIQNLTMRDVGPGQGMSFSAKLTNPKPIGQIDASGNFGPWNGDTPRDTPVTGSYAFSNADLSTIKGIGGILESKGQFGGQLGQIEVQGETETPAFTIDTGGRPMPLHTEFNATVDGATGDTYLHPVNAILGGSKLSATGRVIRESGGHRIVIDVVSTAAQVEDFLKLAVRTDPPLLSGPINVRTSLVLPPSKLPVPERLELSGSFQLTHARFLHPDVQEKLDRLSARAEGHPEEAKDGASPPDIVSSLKSDFTLNQGVIQIGRLTFEIPGGTIALTGDYRLRGAEFSFQGQARLHAKVSQMTTGVKSFFLKAVDPIFAKQGAGTVVPIKISGTGEHPHIALDLGKLRLGR